MINKIPPISCKIGWHTWTIWSNATMDRERKYFNQIRYCVRCNMAGAHVVPVKNLRIFPMPSRTGDGEDD